jgi:hypothetical protein
MPFTDFTSNTLKTNKETEKMIEITRVLEELPECLENFSNIFVSF